MENSLKIFTDWVENSISANPTQSPTLYDELYERLVNEDDYTVFRNLRQVYLWLEEKQSEAADAQWNNELIKIRQIYSELKELCQGTKETADFKEEVKKLLPLMSASTAEARDQLKLVKQLLDWEDGKETSYLTAIERAQEMMLILNKDLPALALEYEIELLNKDLPALALEYKIELAKKVGLCMEVAFTAFAVYAQIVENRSCDDSLYIPNADAIKFFEDRGYHYGY